MGGGGVDGAIHRAGGPEILQQCKEIRRTQFPDGLPTGQAVITTAGRMAAKHVIHTVGPVYGRGGPDKADLLAACYANSLSLALQNDLQTIAFPAISTGVYGYPMREAADGVVENHRAIFGRWKKAFKKFVWCFLAAGDAAVFLKHHGFSG